MAFFVSKKGTSRSLFPSVFYLPPSDKRLCNILRLQLIGFVIKDEVTFNVKSENNLIYISRFNLSLEDDCKIEIAKENIENIVSRCLKNNEVVHSKAFSLVYEQNFDYRRILLIRAFIEYLDQAVLIVNSSAILNTFTSHHHLTALFIKYFIVKFDPCLKGKRETKLESIETKIREEIDSIKHEINILSGHQILLVVTFFIFFS